MGVLISYRLRKYVASLQACCFGYEKGSYKQHRIRMNSVTGYLGTDFIRIPPVPSKKKNMYIKIIQIGLRKKKD